MGTKRVGWARIRSLINENQNDLKFRRTPVRAAVKAATALTDADLGGLILLDASAASTNFEITLPTTPSLGDTFRFVLADDSHSASEILFDSGSDNKIEGYVQVLKEDMENGATAFHSHRKLGFGDSAKKGGRLEIVCVDETVGNIRWVVIDAKSSVTWINTH